MKKVSNKNISIIIICIIVLGLGLGLGLGFGLKKNKSSMYEDFENSHIPKIIHQIWCTTKDIPNEYIKNIEKIKAENPDWEYRFYYDNDIENYLSKFPKLHEAYKKINPKYGAARADFFRYVIVYNEGGVYLDLKSGFRKPLNQIIGNYEYILSHWNESKVASGGPGGDTTGLPKNGECPF